MKLAFADVYRFVAEPGAMDVTTTQMLDPAYLRERAKLIDLRKAQDFGAGNPAKGGTVYLSTADEGGMMVSFIQSNYMGFGSGAVEPHFGISLQNRGHGFNLGTGPGRNTANLVAPGKRPFHTIIPAFLHERRPAGDELRRDGRQHAAAGPCADAGATARPRPGPAGRVRRAALALRRRTAHQRGIGHGPQRWCRA